MIRDPMQMNLFKLFERFPSLLFFPNFFISDHAHLKRTKVNVITDSYVQKSPV